MDDKLFHVSIITPDKTIYEGRVQSLIAPGELGYLGILANHAPLITNLVPGKIILREKPDETNVLYSNGKGILEVLKNNVDILIDSVEKPNSV